MRQSTALILITLALVFSMSLWYSTSIISTKLEVIWNLNSVTSSLLQIAVPIGFIIGTLLSAVLSINKRINNRLVFAYAIFIAGLLNGTLLFIEHDILGITIRILTGICLAGI